jgi:hypothetical protein
MTHKDAMIALAEAMSTPRADAIKKELAEKYPDPIPADRKLAYYMEAAECFGQLAREMELEAKGAIDAPRPSTASSGDDYLRGLLAQVPPYLKALESIATTLDHRSTKALRSEIEKVLIETAAPSSIEEQDDPFCWYIVQRDITDEYTTVYSEAENCPGPNWKPLYERPTPVSAIVKPCPYCTSDNPAIRTTYYDQTCEGCVKRMGAKDGREAGK